jgi:hypothetical protein
MSISTLPLPRALVRGSAVLTAQLDRLRRTLRPANEPETEILRDEMERVLIDRELRRWRNI